jgi:uncharacterized protein YeaO (DUF488 family)
MTIHTTYFSALEHDYVDPDDDSYIVAVVRNPADWVHDLVDRPLEQLAPPKQLQDAVEGVEDAATADEDVDHPTRFAWKTTDFEQQYRDNLTSARLSSVLGTLRAREERGDIWLVSYQKDPLYCHRRILASELTRGRERDPVHHPEPGTEEDVDEDRLPDARLDEFQEGSA